MDDAIPLIALAIFALGMGLVFCVLALAAGDRPPG